MNKLIFALVGTLFSAQIALAEAPAKAPAAAKADAGCDAKAVSKDGKPLAGAAKATFMKKCEADAKK